MRAPQAVTPSIYCVCGTAGASFRMCPGCITMQYRMLQDIFWDSAGFGLKCIFNSIWTHLSLITDTAYKSNI